MILGCAIVSETEYHIPGKERTVPMMKSVVTCIGSMAFAFEEEKVMVLFGPKAPEGLRDISIIHEIEQMDAEFSITPTGRFIVDNQEYGIVNIGSEASKNLAELGHISIYFMDSPDEILPGAIYVSPDAMPRIEVGSIIEFR